MRPPAPSGVRPEREPRRPEPREGESAAGARGRRSACPALWIIDGGRVSGEGLSGPLARSLGAPRRASWQPSTESRGRCSVHRILERHRPDLEAILRETFPRVRAISELTEREVRAILTPEQQRQLDQLKARRRPPPPGPPPSGVELPGPPGFPPPPDLARPSGPLGHPFFGFPPGPPPSGFPPAPPPSSSR